MGVFDEPILPEPLVNKTVFAPIDIVPAVCVIVPVPVAVRVTVVPDRFAPSEMGLFVPVLIRLIGPPDTVIVLVVAMPPEAESIKLKPPLPAVDTPLAVSAVVSVSAMLPAPV